MPRVVAGLCLALVAVTASAETMLWQKTTVGMSPEQVKKLYPTAERTATPLNLTSGSSCWLEMPNVDVLGKPFNAIFCFKAGRLDATALHSPADESFDHARDHFNALLTALRSKYGKEISYNDDGNRDFAMISATFKQGSLSVKASFAGAKGVTGRVSVWYDEWAHSAKNL